MTRYLHGSILVAFFALMLLFPWKAKGQTQRDTDPNSNLWVSHWGDQRIHDRWSLHTEIHWRREDLGVNWQQLLIRPAVNFHLNEQVLFTQGYSYYFNYQYGDHPIRYQNWEHHLYQQVQLTQPLGRIKLQHRFRMEERFIAQLTPSAENPANGEFDHYAYQSRFRYRVWLTIPLGKHEKVEPGVLSANIYDEVFLNFGDSQRLDYIQQNRIAAMLGYQVNKPFSVLFGFLYQTIERPKAANGADLLELNSTIHLALVYNLDLRKQATSPQP